jgi:PAS domain S-box-containing protein
MLARYDAKMFIWKSHNGSPSINSDLFRRAIMFERLIEQIRACHEYAADAKQKAEAAAGPESKASFLDMEQRWLALARSYELTESLGDSSTTTSALREAEERLRWLACIVESSDDAIISKNLDGIITSWNKGAERLFGYTAEEAVGKPVTILIPPDRHNEERIILERIQRGERIEHYETVRMRKDGSSVVISLTVSPVENVEGRIVGASKIARDITERKLAEARERALIAEITHMNRVATAGGLSASIAHELNQPLTGIATKAGAVRRWLAAKKPDMDRVRDALDQIVTASHRAGEIITNIKSMFRKDTLAKAEVDINKLIGTVMGLVSLDLRKHEIGLQMEFNDQLPPVFGNQVQLQQVILNLIMNAIDSMTSAELRVLSIKSKLNQTNLVQVSIEDTGTGIDPSNLDRIFKPLFTTKQHGMGMGLSICQSIIEGHKGRIWVSAGVKRGSIFQFELPTSLDKDRVDTDGSVGSQPVSLDAGKCLSVQAFVAHVRSKVVKRRREASVTRSAVSADYSHAKASPSERVVKLRPSWRIANSAPPSTSRIEPVL